MCCRNLTLKVGLSLLIAGSLPAFSQTPIAPKPPVAPHVTLKDVRFDPPAEDLSSIFLGEWLQFELHEEVVTLVDLPRAWSGSRPKGKVLWSGTLNDQPQKFVAEITASDEFLRDDVGKVVWSKHYDPPSLTLNFDQEDHVTLQDASGHALASGPAPPSDKRGTYVKELPPGAFSRGYRGIDVETDTDQQTTTILSAGIVLWAGHRPPNDLVAFVMPKGRVIVGGREHPSLPPTVFNLELTRGTAGIIISDENHHVLSDKKTGTLRMTAMIVHSDDALLHRRFDWFQHPYDVTPRITLTSPGALYVQYHNASGDWSGEKLIHNVPAVPQTVWNRKHQTYLGLWVAYFDKAGKSVSTVFNGYQDMQDMLLN